MPKKILIVDDEPDIRFTLGIFLESKGFVAVAAENGKAALERLATENFDLMILDLLMPLVDGMGVLRSMDPELKAKLPTIVLTAKTQDEDVLQGYASGATYYMTKPFSNESILNVVNYFIGDLDTDKRMEIERAL
ncbi:MAG: response regulator transcription factor [Deltaproteobacteria bacterium]|nr:response regulator transcription factor [Deltaproteobacteria bacterium]